MPPTTMDHVRHLAETIGPRGSTTPEEEEAARYAAGVLREGGLEPVTEVFTSARSAWYPFALFAGAMLVGELLFWLIGQWGALIGLLLGLAAFICVLLELAFQPNPLSALLPMGRSQNVWVRIPPREETREQVVVLGHLDTHRTPLIFSTRRWTRLFGKVMPAGLLSALVLIALFAVDVFIQGLQWRLASLPFALVLLVLFLLIVQADLTPYGPGANDNASGAAIVLSLATRLKEQPLRRTAVWAVLTGCEEVGLYGADALVQTHRQDLGRPVWISIDEVGGRGAVPGYVVEQSWLLTDRSDPDLLTAADRVAGHHPELDARPMVVRGVYSDANVGGKYGYRLLPLGGKWLEPALSNWHRPTDVVANVDPEVLQRSETFAWELLQEIDRRASAKA